MRAKSFLHVLMITCLLGQTSAALGDRFKFLGELWPADTRAGKLLRTEAKLIRVASGASDTAPACQATKPKMIRRALYSCPSILEVFQIADEFRIDGFTLSALANPSSDISKTSNSEAQKVIRVARGRDYPAYDVVLIMAHFHLAYLNHLYRRPAAEREHLIKLRAVLTSTPVELPTRDLLQFVNSRIG